MRSVNGTVNFTPVPDHGDEFVLKRWFRAKLFDCAVDGEFRLRRASLYLLQILSDILDVDRDVANPEHHRPTEILDTQLTALFEFVVQTK